MSEGYRNLADAVILQAVKDWREAVTRIRKHPHSRYAKERITECEEFFESGWFTELSGLDGTAILERLRREMDIDDG